MLFYAETSQSLGLAFTPISVAFSTLLIPELTLEDLQNNILAAVGDVLTAALAKEMAIKLMLHMTELKMSLPRILELSLGNYFMFIS